MNPSPPDVETAPAPPEQRGFARAARRAGVRRPIARLLEPEALVLYSEQPERVLRDRVAFERAAAAATIGDAGNLELSYRRVDALASALERLGLARESDVPDPFRRVWIENLAGERRQGVVLRRLEDEIAIFCPPSEDTFWDAGAIMRVSYRGFDTAVDYELKLADAVRLPEALVLHLTRPEATGSIGRDDRRLPVQLEGSMRADASPEHPDRAHWSPCELQDMSLGGCRASSRVRYERGAEVDLDLVLHDGREGSVLARAEVRWVREDDMGGHMHGLLIQEFPGGQFERYRDFVRDVVAANGEALGPEELATEPDPEPSAALDAPLMDAAWESIEAEASEASAGDDWTAEATELAPEAWEPAAPPDAPATPEADLLRQRDAALEGLAQVSSELERTGRELSDVLQASSNERRRSTEDRRQVERDAAQLRARAANLEARVAELEEQLGGARAESSAALDALRAEHAVELGRELERGARLDQRLRGLEENHGLELEGLRADSEQRTARLEERLRAQLALRRRLLRGFKLAREEAQGIALELEAREATAIVEREAHAALGVRFAEQSEALGAQLRQREQTAERLAKQLEELKLELLHRTRWQRKFGRLLERFTDPKL